MTPAELEAILKRVGDHAAAVQKQMREQADLAAAQLREVSEKFLRDMFGGPGPAAKPPAPG